MSRHDFTTVIVSRILAFIGRGIVEKCSCDKTFPPMIRGWDATNEKKLSAPNISCECLDLFVYFIRKEAISHFQRQQTLNLLQPLNLVNSLLRISQYPRKPVWQNFAGRKTSQLKCTETYAVCQVISPPVNIIENIQLLKTNKVTLYLK